VRHHDALRASVERAVNRGVVVVHHAHDRRLAPEVTGARQVAELAEVDGAVLALEPDAVDVERAELVDQVGLVGPGDDRRDLAGRELLLHAIGSDVHGASCAGFYPKLPLPAGVLYGHRTIRKEDSMTRWIFGLLAMMFAALTAPIDAGAQGKDTLTVALPSHAPTLDPHMHFERVGVLVNINMFDSLLHRSAKLEFEPSLATSWKALSDTTWEFKLRKGVKFHDGSTMTAEDVKYSFERVLEPGKEKKKSPQYGNIRAIKEVKIVDADTIHLITDKPFPLLLERLDYFGIVPKKHI